MKDKLEIKKKLISLLQERPRPANHIPMYYRLYLRELEKEGYIKCVYIKCVYTWFVVKEL